jgi:hypothetical protein
MCRENWKMTGILVKYELGIIIGQDMTESDNLPSYHVSCQCGVNVWLQLGDKYRACPRCGAPIRGLSSYEVDWDDNKKQFHAVIAFPMPENSNDVHLLVAR